MYVLRTVPWSLPVTINTLTLEHTEVYLFKDTFGVLFYGVKKDVGDRNSNEFSAHTNWDPEFQFGSTGRAPRVCGLNRGSGLRTRTTLLGYDIRTVSLFHLLLCSSSE